MKHLILAMSLLFSSLSLQAYVSVEDGKIQNAEFEKMSVRHDFLSGINEGSVLINEIEGTLVLDLYQDLYCKPMQPCITLEPNAYKVTLEIASIELDACGARVITAVKDRTTVDGLYEQVVVTDHSTANCEYYVEHATHVLYKSTSPRAQMTQVSEFYGNKLQDLPIAF